MSDKTLVCRECGREFTFTAGEQAFYQERGYTEPGRCPECRQARKAERAQHEGGSASSYGGGRSSYASGPRQMYPAVCAACGKETEVPFPPRSDKPVYCRECFQERRASSPRYDRY